MSDLKVQSANGHDYESRHRMNVLSNSTTGCMRKIRKVEGNGSV